MKILILLQCSVVRISCDYALHCRWSLSDKLSDKKCPFQPSLKPWGQSESLLRIYMTSMFNSLEYHLDSARNIETLLVTTTGTNRAEKQQYTQIFFKKCGYNYTIEIHG